MAADPVVERSVIDAMALPIIEIDLADLGSQIGSGGSSFDVDQMRSLLASDPGAFRRKLDTLRIVHANQPAILLMGACSLAELTGPFSRFWPESSLGALMADVEALLAKSIFRTETILRRADGAALSVIYMSWTPPDGAESRRRFASITDIGDRAKSEEALGRIQADLAHAGRLSTMEELVASIAHEVNQPLLAVVANAQAGLRWLDRPQPNLAELKAALETIVVGSRRAADVIAHLRAMSRNQPLEIAPLSITHVVEEAMLLVRHEMARHQTSIRLSLPKEPILALGDRTQILQVIVNLIMNAAQAMSNGHCWRRTLTLRATVEHATDMVVIEVEDTGPGITQPNQDRLFENFFTTKADGIGIGLGICRSIVEGHGGEIRVRSRASLGATFSFTIPVARADQACSSQS